MGLGVVRTAKRVRPWLNGLGRRRVCPLCGFHGFHFQPFGKAAIRADAICPRCRSLERHRLAYLLVNPMLAPGQATLHVAPEPAIEPWLRERSRAGGYLSIDLVGQAMQRMDLTALTLPDNSQSLVWCSHVLEHIPADRQAMAEMHRVLTPGGMAVIQVPIRGPSTYEDWSITTPQGRQKAFMQDDHVRIYGLDIVDRLQSVGFAVEVKRAADLPPAVVYRHAAASDGANEVLICRKSP